MMAEETWWAVVVRSSLFFQEEQNSSQSEPIDMPKSDPCDKGVLPVYFEKLCEMAKEATLYGAVLSTSSAIHPSVGRQFAADVRLQSLSGRNSPSLPMNF